MHPGTIFFNDTASPATLSRAVKDGGLRRIAQGLYSADLHTPAEQLVTANVWEILAHSIPDALVADRSAAGGGTVVDGLLTVVSQQRTTDLKLPGLLISPRKGHGPLPDDRPWPRDLRCTSDARTLVDNLALSRGRAGRPARTLSLAELEDWVVAKARMRAAGWTDGLRRRAMEICGELDVQDRVGPLGELLDAIDGTRRPRDGAEVLLRARSQGLEYDPGRLEAFDDLARHLADIPTRLDVPKHLAPSQGDLRSALPFFEAYFSNFIEGTEFAIDEAEAIVANGEVPADRPEDGHDILGTFHTVADPRLRAATPGTPDELVELLRERHRHVMTGRPGERPGELKTLANRAGSYDFVDPQLVEGTLLEGARRLLDLPPGFPRAAFELFLTTEVHPFDDGTGRVARAGMCAQLTATDQARIVVPIGYRTEYMDALRALSRAGRAELYIRMLTHLWRWTAAMPWQDRAALDGQLEATNALLDPTDAAQTGRHLQLP